MDGMAKVLTNVKLDIGFSIIKVLSCGNNGTTALALDEIRAREVVLKFYHRRNTVNEGIHEFKILKKLDYAPFTVKAYNCFFTGRDNLLLVLEDLSICKSPYKVVEQFRDTFTMDQRLEIARNACTALAELHSV